MPESSPSLLHSTAESPAAAAAVLAADLRFLPLTQASAATATAERTTPAAAASTAAACSSEEKTPAEDVDDDGDEDDDEDDDDEEEEAGPLELVRRADDSLVCSNSGFV